MMGELTDTRKGGKREKHNDVSIKSDVQERREKLQLMVKNVARNSTDFVLKNVLDSLETLGALSWDLLEACVQQAPPNVRNWASKWVPGGGVLSKPPPRKTLVLDLDETLIHSTSRGSRNHDHVIEVLVDRHVCLYYIFKRPHVDFFLEKVSQWYDLVIFTASMSEYADPVVDFLDPEGKLFSRRFFRHSCTQQNSTYLKDLSIVEPDLSRVFLIDNSPICYALNADNGVPIETWISDPNDEALLDLLPFLDCLRHVSDVRSILSLRV